MHCSTSEVVGLTIHNFCPSYENDGQVSVLHVDPVTDESLATLLKNSHCRCSVKIFQNSLESTSTRVLFLTKLQADNTGQTNSEDFGQATSE